MRLNQQTGEITIGNESLDSSLTEETLRERFSAYQLKLYVDNIHLSLWRYQTLQRIRQSQFG
ncbi:MAG: hypothetical protein JWQ85_1677 [Mucilaginibacter sp.]|nr:hypothetical protein [Mucilaginibacter sp.]